MFSLRYILEAKKWVSDINPKWSFIIYKIFKSDNFNELPKEYQEKVYQKLDELYKEIFETVQELEDCLYNFCLFFFSKELNDNPNKLNYLDVLLDYPQFPVMNSSLLEQDADNDKDVLTYLRVEAQLFTLDGKFGSVMKNFEEIIQNEKLKRLGLTEVIVNGLVNTYLDKSTLILDISYLLFLGEDYYPLILKLFQAHTADYNSLVFNLLNDKEVVDSGHLSEMIEMIYATPLENFKELEFKITHKLIYEEMTFEDACRNYCDEAMKILDENEHIKSTTRVRVPVYQNRKM